MTPVNSEARVRATRKIQVGSGDSSIISSLDQMFSEGGLRSELLTLHPKPRPRGKPTCGQPRQSLGASLQVVSLHELRQVLASQSGLQFPVCIKAGRVGLLQEAAGVWLSRSLAYPKRPNRRG